MKVEWHARDVHPWDSDLPAWRKTELFTVGLIADTVVAIRQAFEVLAEVDVIQIRVVDPNEAERTVLAGTVCRDDVSAALDSASPAMSLRLLGVQHSVVDGSFQPVTSVSACDSGGSLVTPS